MYALFTCFNKNYKPILGNFSELVNKFKEGNTFHVYYFAYLTEIKVNITLRMNNLTTHSV